MLWVMMAYGLVPAGGVGWIVTFRRTFASEVLSVEGHS